MIYKYKFYLLSFIFIYAQIFSIGLRSGLNSCQSTKVILLSFFFNIFNVNESLHYPIVNEYFPLYLFFSFLVQHPLKFLSISFYLDSYGKWRDNFSLKLIPPKHLFFFYSLRKWCFLLLFYSFIYVWILKINICLFIKKLSVWFLNHKSNLFAFSISIFLVLLLILYMQIQFLNFLLLLP